MDDVVYDLLVIGGGINGAGIAADAAGRGLSVMLCEQDDLAGATSWKSSKLIHGGLRYLEYYEFRLVREALKEREIMLRKAPHIIWPLRFVIPHQSNLRPAWLLRLGLFLYDHLSHRYKLGKSKRLNLRDNPAGQPLKPDFNIGFSYADCYVDDARLVVLNAIQAQQLGAKIHTRTRVISAERLSDHWQVILQDRNTEVQTKAKAKVLINAAGPWVEQVMHKLNVDTKHHMALVKGSHIVVPKLYEGDYAFILQNTDKRVIFIIPFMHHSLIGTTDIAYTGDPYNVEVSREEINYLICAVNQYLKRPLSANHIIWQYAGVRPLLNDDANNPSAITRSYCLELSQENNLAPILNIFGGKITTYRKLAEDALHLLKPHFTNMGSAWTAKKPLPGGDIPDGDFSEFLHIVSLQYGWMPTAIVKRYAQQYGTMIHKLLANAKSLTDMGTFFGAGLYQREVEYLVKNEWARTAEDILWRRTKLGLHFPQSKMAELEATIAAIVNYPSL